MAFSFQAAASRGIDAVRLSALDFHHGDQRCDNGSRGFVDLGDRA